MPAPEPPCTIRLATEADVPVVVELIRALAEYERLADHCVATEAAVRASLFGPRPEAEVLVAAAPDDPAGTLGFALFFHNYSTFLARRGLYLEDLFVRPEARGRGVGRALLAELARIAVARGCGRFEWSVLTWNALAIGLYERVGARRLDDWVTYRLEGEALAALAAEAPPG